jgi:hypothetical protein
MKMRCLVILSYFLLVIMACDKPIQETPVIPFEKTYGGTLADYATGAVALNEHIYIVGTTKSL